MIVYVYLRQKQNYIDKHEFTGYECFCYTGGGIYSIAILVKDHLCKEIELSKNVGSKNVLWLYIKSLDITIGAVYIPPENSINSDNDVYDVMFDDISTILPCADKTLYFAKFSK